MQAMLVLNISTKSAADVAGTLISLGNNVHIEYLKFLSRIALYSRYRATHHKRSHANLVVQQINGPFQHKSAKEFYVKCLLVK